MIILKLFNGDIFQSKRNNMNIQNYKCNTRKLNFAKKFDAYRTMKIEDYIEAKKKKWIVIINHVINVENCS